VLERGRDLLGQLRQLADVFAAHADPGLDRSDPLAILYRETVAMTDTALRLIPLFPDTATAQLHLCEGLESILNVVARHLRTLSAGVERHRARHGTVTRLAHLLTELETGRAADVAPFVALAEEVLADARECGPLVFHEADVSHPERFVAAHSLTVARVVARVVRHDPDLRGRLLEPVLAALVHDAGMLRVPAEVLAAQGPLDDEARRAVEAHCRAGGELAARLLPDAPWLAEAATSHHERLDGTGYPDGLKEFQLSPLTRLLAVCDVYAGLCAPRPYRAARETRTAMADTLLMAEHGRLDRNYAEHLLQLSFYPVGSVVELADGAVGVVVATPLMRRDLNTPARPVVALLTDPQGVPLGAPRHLDLAQCDDHSIVRTLSARERRDLLARRLPEWVQMAG
jgi:HD-GYP domain-containing protein (c-di-GMP phosphodiesterase class II)